MNPTLEQLAHEAGITVNAESAKFAELIVRECAKQVDNYWDEFENGYADKKILEHFGVEE